MYLKLPYGSQNGRLLRHAAEVSGGVPIDLELELGLKMFHISDGNRHSYREALLSSSNSDELDFANQVAAELEHCQRALLVLQDCQEVILVNDRSPAEFTKYEKKYELLSEEWDALQRKVTDIKKLSKQPERSVG